MIMNYGKETKRAVIRVDDDYNSYFCGFDENNKIRLSMAKKNAARYIGDLSDATEDLMLIFLHSGGNMYGEICEFSGSPEYIYN